MFATLDVRSLISAKDDDDTPDSEFAAGSENEICSTAHSSEVNSYKKCSSSPRGASDSQEDEEAPQISDQFKRRVCSLVVATSFIIVSVLLFVRAPAGLSTDNASDSAHTFTERSGKVHEHKECSNVEEFGDNSCSKEIRRLIADRKARWEYGLTTKKFHDRFGSSQWTTWYPKTFAWYPASTFGMDNKNKEDLELPDLHFEDLQFLIHMRQPKEQLCPLPCFRSLQESNASSSFSSNAGSRESAPPSLLANTSCPPKPAKPGPPKGVLDYNGISWPSMCFEGDGEEHVFIIGDWGGVLPGTPADNTKFDHHTDGWNKTGRPFVHGLDDTAQLLVAREFMKRAKEKDPRYILNVGDNFYWGGCNEFCATRSMEEHVKIFNSANNSNANNNNCTHQFYAVFETMYMGPGVNGKPWISCLGNHDYGGYFYDSAWDQQIAYTWGPSGRWVLPALYYHQHVSYPTKGFTVDYYVLDTNVGDVTSPWSNPKHNPCSGFHKKVSNCTPFGPQNAKDCVTWFRELWGKQAVWLEKMLSKSVAEWQIILTHYPPEDWIHWKQMYYDLKRIAQRYGVDLFITGHRHVQTMYESGRTGWCGTPEIPYVVSGGGGGITSDFIPGDAGDCHWSTKNTAYLCNNMYDKSYAVEKEGKRLNENVVKGCDDPNWYDWDPRWQQAECDKLLQPEDGQDMYGFMDMTISKDEITIEGFNHEGTHRGTMSVKPREPQETHD